MIIDTLNNFRKYLALNPRFAAVADFLEQTDLAALTPGRYDILADGEAFANVSDAQHSSRETRPFEFHRKYTDVQIPLEVAEEMGWTPAAGLPAEFAAKFDAEKDVALDSASADTWAAIHPGQFVLFFPSDAHAPCGGAGIHRKIIIKVLN